MSKSTKTTISHDDYLRLIGLLTLAADHRKSLEAIGRAALEITGEQPNLALGESVKEVFGLTGDAVYGEDDADSLLRKLEISVAPARPR